MKDTRLQQALAALDDARTSLSDILEETSHSSEDHAYLFQAYNATERAIRNIQKAQEDRVSGECLCWVGHGDCGGCSGVVGIGHEPACGWDWNPGCPKHGGDSARDVIAQVLRSAGILLPNDYTPAWSYDRKLDELAAEIDTALGVEVGELRRLRAAVLRVAEAYEQSAAELPTPHGAATEAFKTAARDIRVALIPTGEVQRR